MPFKKTAVAEILGVSSKGVWKKAAGKRLASVYMDGGKSLNLEEILDTVADTYIISRDPNDYLLIPARAVTANVPNDNLDFFGDGELKRFNASLGSRVYSTFNFKPHFVNHNAADSRVARGVVVDSSYNDLNDASDPYKKSVYASIGSDPDKEEFVECLIAMDMSKDPALAQAYKNASVDKFSMGCDVSSTTCSVCGKVATTTWDFCEHVRSKHSGREYDVGNGLRRRAFEICNDVIFAELSCVDEPADKSAVVQDGLISVGDYNPNLSLIASYVANNPRAIDEQLAGIFNKILSN